MSIDILKAIDIFLGLWKTYTCAQACVRAQERPEAFNLCLPLRLWTRRKERLRQNF